MKTVLAKLQLLPTTKGGRSTPLVPARDFGCPVFFKDVPGLTEHGYDCRFLIRTFGKIIHPGETVWNVPLAFLSPEEVLPHVKIGTKFALWESGWIGEGEITAINE
jgi:hypothetical protein